MHFLRSPVEVSSELARDESIVEKDIAKFLETYKMKQDVLHGLNRGESIHHHLHKLKYALHDELALLHESVNKEKEIISDLKYLSKDSLIRRIDSLHHKIKDLRDEDKIIRHVIDEIHSLAKSQAQKVHSMLKGDTSETTLLEMKELLIMEQHIVEKLSTMEELESFFKGICTGETRESFLDDAESRFRRSVCDRMTNITVENGKARSNDSHYISKLTANIFNKLRSTIMQSVNEGLMRDHPYVDYEFVQSPYFEEFVKKEIEHDRSKGLFVPRQKTIQMFIQIFRKLYNTEALAQNQ